MSDPNPILIMRSEAASIQRALDCLEHVRRSGAGWTARCPGHDDRKDSLSIGKGNDGRVLLNCHAGCEVETVVSALGLVMADLFEANTPRKIRATAQQPQKGARKTPSSTVAGHKTAETTGCTLAAYSEAKGLPVPFLQGLGLRDYPYQGQPSVRIPYLTSDGHTACSRFRIALSGDKFRWKSGAKPCLYGLWRLEVETRHVAIVEGESDCQTLWLHDIDAVGLPGATTWREERDAKHFDDIPRIYVVVEGDKGGEAVLRWLANSTIRDRVWLVDLGKHKDPSGLYLADTGCCRDNWQAALYKAIKWTDREAEAVKAASDEAWRRCRKLAESPDILGQFAEHLRIRVVGEERAAKLLYLSVTSRFFKRPISVVVKGPSSGGKSFLTEQVLNFFPPDAYYALTAMSPHAMAYSDEPLIHRFLVLYEATGMGSDIQTYMMRSLLSEGRIRYETVEKTSEGIRPRLMVREGPTGLLVTTTSARLHPENETRLLSLTVSDSQEQTEGIMGALACEAADDGAVNGIDYATWHALQTWLASANHRVVVPYAPLVAREVKPVAVRLRRDLKAVLNLIRAHALLHQASRECDEEERVMATIDDYRAVHELVADLISADVEATVPRTVRETVEAVQRIISVGQTEVGVTDLCKPLMIERQAVWRRVKQAQHRGYLRNAETVKGKPARLVIGEPMPDDIDIFPSSERLECLLHGCARSEGGTYPSPRDETDPGQEDDPSDVGNESAAEAPVAHWEAEP